MVKKSKQEDEIRQLVRQQLMEELSGGSFWSDFADGFMSVVKPVASVAKTVMSAIPHPYAQAGSSVLNALGAGVKDKPKKKRRVNPKMKKRGELIKKIMKEYECSMIDASKIIKEQNLL